MSTSFDALSDVWTLLYSLPESPTTILVSKAISAGDAVVAATAQSIPTSGTYGLRLRNGSETVRLYLGTYLADEPAKSIAVDVPTAPVVLVLAYTDATKLVTGSYSLDSGTTWTTLSETVTMAAAPTFGDLFFEQFNAAESVSVSFLNFRALAGTLTLPYPTTGETFNSIGAGPVSQPPALTPTQQSVIHALVGAQFGDLEFDIGKSVRWTQWFADDVFITDVNYGTQRYWIIDWAQSFPFVNYKTSSMSVSYFDDPIAFRKQQFADAEQFAFDHDEALVFDNNDWVLWVDAHEGLSVDNTLPYPPDYDFDLFRSYVAREIRTAIEAGKDRITLPFFAFVRHGDIQNVEYDWIPNQVTGPKVVQPMGVPYYVPYRGLVRLMKVSALRNPSFDWSLIDTSPDPAIPGYITFPSTAGNNVTTPDSTALDITGTDDLCIVVYAAADDWTPAGASPAGDQVLVSKFTSPGQGSWKFQLHGTTGMPELLWSNDGSTTFVVNGTTAPTVSDGGWLWLAVTFDVSDAGNKVGRFWTSSDGTTWTQLGATRTLGTATTIFNSTAPLVISGWTSSGVHSNMFAGKIGYVSVRRGIGAGGIVGGTEVFRYDGLLDLMGVNPSATTLVASTGQTLTVNRAGSPSLVITPSTPGSIPIEGVKLQVVSYGYAHWNLQDIPPGETGVPALTAENDLGWQQRNLLSKVRPIPGLPYGATWQFPNTDTPGLAGPWAPDTFSNQVTGVVIPAARPAIDPACAGVRVPLYDSVLRLNTRDGVWYTGDGQGNVPLEWDAATSQWVAIPAEVT